ncbi:Zn-dependent exopeptidase [Periconia macrospinosa]|uniref:Zn-dependent exopeptidase n=1 Tax=Periconia macrospinosa TaxID=97972 RepID=A0A2V1D4P7_9PLEO|nr:Zn-dependent exopeptidase [Periconia macrospinosa]
MPDEKHLYDAFQDPPIPTYEEATSSSHPLSSRRGPDEISDDAERQTLLGHDLPVSSSSGSRRRNGYYQPPSVQSARSSLDDDDESGLGSPVEADEDVALRQTMEEMDILDPEAAEDGRGRRNRSRTGFSKRFYSITTSLSSIHLPRIPWPSFGFEWFKQRLPTIPEEYRPGWSVLARLLGLILIITLVYLLVASEIVPMGAGGFGAPWDPETVRHLALGNVDTGRINENLKYITSYDHVAGTKGSYALGQWIESQFKESHMKTYTHDEYFVYMNYPRKDGRRVAIVDPPEKAWQAKLEEGSPYDPRKPQTESFHGFSRSGNVTGPLIYVNYGDKKDFKALWDGQIDVQGCVVLMRYYGTPSDRALKLKAAQDAGVAGVLMYSDPADDGFLKGDVAPNGRWRPKDGVQRGSVAFSNMIIGDPTTPGRPSTKDQMRLSTENNVALPNIPSIPLSWEDAQHLLQSLEGIGTELPEEWTGGVPDVKWFTGHPEKSPKVYLQNFQDEEEQQRITNVFGSLPGVEDGAKKIIIGSHRDSWCFGAADPGSGTAVMLEVARVLGELRMRGWHPLRTIEFASWDAEEYNMMGSTEHVEQNIDELRANALAYINVDVGVTGDKLWANGSPLFKHTWGRVLGRLVDPQENKTLFDLWERDNHELGALAATSDHAAFQDLAGTSSIEFGFKGPEHGDLAHSCYATYEWMTTHIDKDLTYHTLLAQIWVLFILELAQEPIMPLKLEDYASYLAEEAQKLLDSTEKVGHNFDIAIFQPLFDAVRGLTDRAREFGEWETFWYNNVYGAGGFETQGLTIQRVHHNSQMGLFETRLLDLPTSEKENKGAVSDHGVR